MIFHLDSIEYGFIRSLSIAVNGNRLNLSNVSSSVTTAPHILIVRYSRLNTTYHGMFVYPYLREAVFHPEGY